MPPPPHTPPPLVEGIDWMAAQEAVRTVSNKWVITIVAALVNGPLRYSDLHRAVGPAVSQKMLTETLHLMRRDRLIVRAEGPTSATSVPYGLSDSGRSLLEPLESLARWYNRATAE